MPVENTTLTRVIEMQAAVTIADRMIGSVRHHSGHIIGWTGGENPSPIYCSGHSVSGSQVTGQSKVMIQGKPAATVGDSGNSNCACDGAGYTNIQGSPKVFINGRAAVRLGDKVNIHGQGTGTMVSGHAKVNFI